MSRLLQKQNMSWRYRNAQLVLLFHYSSLKCALFSSDAVEVDASVEAAAIDDELGSLVAIHGLADDLFAKNIEHVDGSVAVDGFCRINAYFMGEWGWIDGVSKGCSFVDGCLLTHIEHIAEFLHLAVACFIGDNELKVYPLIKNTFVKLGKFDGEVIAIVYMEHILNFSVVEHRPIFAFC